EPDPPRRLGQSGQRLRRAPAAVHRRYRRGAPAGALPDGRLPLSARSGGDPLSAVASLAGRADLPPRRPRDRTSLVERRVPPFVRVHRLLRPLLLLFFLSGVAGLGYE